MKKKCLFVIVGLASLMAYAQDLPNIIPPSPEASALAKFTNVPVSHYTGLPDISIPIYTIKNKDITIPISLSYHARGVQVSEAAPRTGLGWSLLYGGSVTRQTRGKGDDASGQYTYFGETTNFMNYPNSLTARQSVNVREDMDPSYDFYPDQFSFNAGDISGKFVFDYNDLEPVIQSYGDVKISFTRELENGVPGRINAFVITDSKGMKYYFGISRDGLRFAADYQVAEGMSIFNNGNVELDPPGSPSAGWVYSSWKLMDIETPSGELISYFYESPESALAYYRKSVDKHLVGGETTVTNALSNMGDINKIVTRLSKTWNYEKQLSRIEFNQGRDSIVFYKSSQLRDDFDGYALDRISVYHRNKLIKSFKLNYTYTVSTDQTNLLWYFINNPVFNKSFKRMFLESVEEENSLGEKLPPYVFTYDHSESLPSLFSSRQDYWGYYNGATNNGPFTRMFNYGMYTPNRRVDTLKSEIGMLKEIKYPTGGKSKFTYEHNRGRLPYYFSSLKLPAINPSTENEVEMVLTKDDFMDSQGNFNSSYSLSLPASTLATFKFNCFHLQYEGQDPIPDCLFYFSLNGSPINYGNDSVYELGEEITYYGSSTGGPAMIGAYPISGVNPPDLYLNPDYDFEIIVKYNLPDLRENLYGAGKRIKKIENIDENGNVLVKEFEYNFPASDDFPTAAPSGGIIGLAGYLNTKNVGDNGGFILYTHYNDVSSYYSSFQPNSIGYSSVIEYYGTKNDNIGKTEYTFTNLIDTGGDFYEFPYHPPTDNEWLRGKNINTKFYKKDTNGDYSLLKEVYNKYLYGGNEYEADFELFGFLHQDFVFTVPGSYHDWTENDTTIVSIKNRTLFKLPLFMRQRYEDASIIPGYRIYYLTGGTVDLKYTIEKNYNDNGIIEKTTTHNYDYDRHYQLKESITINSQNDELKTAFYYPTDVLDLSDLSSSATRAANGLYNQNRLEVLETEVTNNQTAISRVRTNFDIINNLIVPKTVETAKGDLLESNDFKERIVYHEYDVYGNPLEVSKKNGAHIVYIWGYGHTQPIAKVENATHAEVESALSSIGSSIAWLQWLSDFDNDRTQGHNGNEGALRLALDNMRNSGSLSKAMVTTFTYDPLVGVTSITDPRGNTIYYEYDEFNRLKQVKDQDGNILSQNEYHYKGQQ